MAVVHPRKIVVTAAVIAALATLGTTLEARGGSRPQKPSGERMTAAAAELTRALDDHGRARASMAFDDEERLRWAYTPIERKGMPMGAMSEDAKQLATALLHTALGPTGYDKAQGIIALEEELFERSGGRAMRDPGNYFVSIFGPPGDDSAWGWRFEGHHLSVNFTLIDGIVVGTTPAFFGGNPAHVTEGTRAGLRPLAEEEDWARELVKTFHGDAAHAVMIPGETPRDVLTGNSAFAEPLADAGTPLSAMTERQRELLLRLIGLYADRLHRDLAAHEQRALRQAGIDNIRFAWAGGTEPGQPHYYRIQGPTFLIEYDNTQSDANHIHSVWRNFERDFGRDPLRDHLADDHGLDVRDEKPPGATHRHGTAAPHTH